MDTPIAKTRGEAKVKNTTRSYNRYKKIEKAIHDASDGGRCWWIERYLKHSLFYHRWKKKKI